MLNNINNNNFDTQNKLQKNGIEIDNYFWNLNTNFKHSCIYLIYKNYIIAKIANLLSIKI